MYQNEIVKIIQYLTLFELDVNTPISEEIINREFKRLAKIYHPDVANDRYKDGKKFIELIEGKTYLLKNIYKVNELIINRFNKSTNDYGISKQKKETEQDTSEEMKKSREEALKKSKEEDERRQEEKQTRINSEKKHIELELKLLLDNIDKNNYYEKDYKKIVNLITSFLQRLPVLSLYKIEYVELKKKIKSVKTIKELKRFNLYKILVICICTFVALITILAFLFKFYFLLFFCNCF